MKIGIVVFPGSNCDHDVYHVLKHELGAQAEFIWHKNQSLEGADAVVLPGGFSYGDYLRSGAVAAQSPVMAAVKALAAAGGPVLGICNGFQILCEAGLLPGALMRNQGLRFIGRSVAVRVENETTLFTALYRRGETLHMPVANFDGSYYAGEETLARLEGEGRVVFRYVDNPNGSARNIAGIINSRGNVMGMMPHPERAADGLLGSEDGRRLFQALAEDAVRV